MKISNYTYYQIDKGLRKSIRKLNEKGYLTFACCEGHIKDDKHRWTSYIGFNEDYDFAKPIPKFNGKDAYMEKRNRTYRWYGKKKGTVQERERHRQSWLKRIEKWVDELPTLE